MDLLNINDEKIQKSFIAIISVEPNCLKKIYFFFLIFIKIY